MQQKLMISQPKKSFHQSCNKNEKSKFADLSQGMNLK